MEQARFAGNDPKRPKYVDANRSWPTPRCCTGKHSGEAPRAEFYRAMGLPKVGVDGGKNTRQPTGQLSPDWVAWLMGWPIGWESLEPMTEMIWLDWSVDPADLEEPEEYPTPMSVLKGKTGNQIQEWGKNRFRKEPLKRGIGPIPRVATGIKDRVNRLKALGNGQVPQVAVTAWEILKPVLQP